ncbi:MAG: C10 family peptidase [Paludibacteraceae bacterium]|nr:C10 family peptidase [Paludibacteraceae bacterium]
MKKILISLLAVILTTGLFAAQRTVEEAAAIAKQVNYSNLPMVIKKGTPALVPQRQDHSVRLVHTQLQPKSDKAAFYVFDRDQEGFVVVSADDNTRDVLAYSEESTFPEQVPNNVQFLLNYIAERVASAAQSGNSVPVTATYTPVAPMLDGIKWDQGAPYSNNCPLDGGYRSVTGCAATATAQVMRYWNWPETGTGSHSYYCSHLASRLSVNFANTTYDWANMPKTTAEYKTTVQKNAVATLMYHVGVAIDMDYSSEGSGAQTSNIATALVDYFGYKNTCEYKSTCEWDNTRGEWVISEPAATTAQYMRAELAQGRPVIVGGFDEEITSGHGFVFEGYDKNGLFYVNWGWSGMCNGYYAIDNLTPEELGIGAGFGDYSYYLEYIIGIEPNKVDDPSTPKQIRGLQYGQALYVTQEPTIWAVDLYNDWIDNAYVYPELYFNIIAKSKTLLAGTYNLEYMEYAPTSDKAIKLKSDGVVTISLAQGGKYRFVGSFVGTDDRTYTFDQTVFFAAYDYQTKEELTLEDKLENATIVIEDYQSTAFTTTDGLFTVLGEKAGALSSPTYDTGQKDLRNYAKGTFTLTYNAGNMTKITFNLSEQGKKRQATITPSVGNMTYDVENGHVVWTGNAAQVIFTVGEKATYGSDGSSKGGQFDFVSIDLELTESPAPQRYDIVVNSADLSRGVAIGGGSFEAGSNVMIMAANTDEDYVFDQWQDGNTAAARVIYVDKPTTYTAYFVPRTAVGCVEVASNDETLGTAVVAVMAIPTNGGTFLRWDDDNTDNPRIINELDGTIYTAIFATNPSDVQKVESNDGQAIRKLIKNDRLYIIRNGIEYIATGARVK